MLITPEVARDIAKIIRDHHTAVVAALLGRRAVSQAEWTLAANLGLVSDEPGQGMPTMEALHAFGALVAHRDQAPEGMTLSAFLDHVRKHPVPRTQLEHHAAAYNSRYGAHYITGLGDRVVGQVLGMAHEADRETESKTRGLLRDITSAKFGDEEAATRLREAGIERELGETFFEDEFRSSIKRTTSNMGHATEDWTRDLQRIAQTEGHWAICEGVKESWIEQEEAQARDEERSPRRILAYKLPRPDACDHCVRLHLQAGNPRLYWLDEIQGNGTNVGRKAQDWLIVIGSTHPWCGCTLHRVPFILVEKVTNTKGWRSGKAAPSVIGPGGDILGA